jgi:ethanolamine utilization protein EutA
MSAAPETAPAAAALLAWAAGELRAAGVPEPDADAELLVDDALRRLKEDVGRRAVREPLAYVRGEVVFRGLRLAVDERVFVPRPETELLVEATLAVPHGAAVLEPCTGSGAVALSRHTHRTVLNVDIGGGTTKFALVENGVVRSTCAIAVGARVSGEPGELAEAVLSTIRGQAPQGLLVTQPLQGNMRPHLVTFSGGVAEYIFGRETRSFGDIAQPLAACIREAFARGRLDAPMMDPGQGIRATVIGASQFTVQLSGKTIHLSEGVGLPVRNVPVLFPPLGLEYRAQEVAQAITDTLAASDLPGEHAVALGIRWRGEPHYQRLRELAAGIAMAAGGASLPLILMVDRDVGRLLGHILEHELWVGRAVIAIDGIELRQFDYVDIGEPVQPANVVPVIIKSLVFPSHCGGNAWTCGWAWIPMSTGCRR